MSSIPDPPANSTELHSRPRILVVDDEPDALALCERSLRDRYDVVTALSAEEALSLLGGATFAVAVADERLPGMSGVELLSRLHRDHPNTGRVLMTGFASQESALEAINTGRVHAFILKPWQPTAFLEVVNREARVASLRRELEEEHRRYRSLIYDERWDLPTRQCVSADVAELMVAQGFMGVLVIDASNIFAVDHKSEAVVHLQATFVDAFKQMRGQLLREEDILCVDEVGSPVFCLFLTKPRDARFCCDRDVRSIAERAHDFLATEIQRVDPPAPIASTRIAVGHGFNLYHARYPTDRQIRRLVAQARDRAHRILDQEDDEFRKSQIERVIVNRTVTTVFQPIFHLRTRVIHSYEALSRGPEATELESPEHLLHLADRLGLSLELDRVFRTVALVNAARLPEDTKVFINTLPATLYDPIQNAERLGRFLADLGLDPHRLVFECSEKYVLGNQKMFLDAMAEHRDLGIQLAIDDVGVGYSGLERIAQLDPDFLKIDLSLIREIKEHPVKQSIVKALVGMAQSLDAIVIAEGIETESDVECLTEIGVEYGQGYHLARPAAQENAE